jgi:hypothetical protein
MPGANDSPDRGCAVCGRHLLIGERANPFVTRDGLEVVVCELCKPRAEAEGWLRPEEAAVTGSSAGRRRKRRRGNGDLLGGLRSRVDRAAGDIAGAVRGDDDPDGGDEEPERADRSAPARRRETPEPAQAVEAATGPTMRSSAGPDVLEAIQAFNVSDGRRTVGSLSKALGEPQATALAIRTASGDTGARITVAWELAWYQWEVGPGRKRPEVRQIAKGETIDQLRASDRNWNLDVSRDGTLARRPVGGPPE